MNTVKTMTRETNSRQIAAIDTETSLESVEAIRNETIDIYCGIIRAMRDTISPSVVKIMATWFTEQAPVSVEDFEKERKLLGDCIGIMGSWTWYGGTIDESIQMEIILSAISRTSRPMNNSTSIFGNSTMGRFAESLRDARRDYIFPSEI